MGGWMDGLFVEMYVQKRSGRAAWGYPHPSSPLIIYRPFPYSPPDPPEWVDAHPAQGSGGIHYSTGEHGDDAHSAPSDAPHAVEVTFLGRLDMGAGAGADGDGKAKAAVQQQQQQQGQRATCLSTGLWGQHLLLGRDRVGGFSIVGLA